MAKRDIRAARVFRSRMSKWIAGLYWFLILLFVGIAVVALSFSGMPQQESTVLLIAFTSVSALMGFILYRAYTLTFTVTQNRIVVSGIFRKHIIRLSNVKSVEKTLIPLGMRLAGASLLGGYYYVFGLGVARVAMTNFNDGVLITTKRKAGRVKHYVVTPDRPQEFIRVVKRRK